MALTVEYSAHGRAAARVLATWLAAQRADDPLAPAIVIVPRSWAGISLRRLLASGELDGHPGLANVTFTTLAMLAAEVAAPRLASSESTPLTQVALGAAVRSALRSSSGLLREVAEHSSTERAVADLWRDLHGVSPGALRVLASKGRLKAEVASLIESISIRLTGYHDSHKVLTTATEAARQASLGERLGSIQVGVPIAVFVPEALASAELEFVQALRSHTSVFVVAGLHGDPEADTEISALVARLNPDAAPPTLPAVSAPTATKIISAPSQDAEVREVLRDVARRIDSGTRLERIAITYAQSRPYARLAAEACERAAIPIVAPATRTLAQTVPGRALLNARAVIDDDWTPSSLQHLIETAPATRRGVPLSAGLIARLGSKLGVVRSHKAWTSKLGKEESRLHHALAEAEPGDDTSADALRSVAALASYLHEAYDALIPSAPRDTWSAWVTWVRTLTTWLLGDLNSHDSWPAEQREALSALSRALDELSTLDTLDPAPGEARFWQALNSVLEQPAPQTTRLGHGIVMGPIGSAVGLDLDVVYVLGANDGALPSATTGSALLPDSERASMGLPLTSVSVAQQRATWLAALSSAPERVVSFARNDDRSGREARAARWALDSLTHIARDQTGGRRIFSSGLADIEPTPGYQRIASVASAALSATSYASASDLDACVLARAAQHHDAMASHWLASGLPELQRAWRMLRSRRLGLYDEFEGRVRLSGRPSPVGAAPMSATRLENYAKCPRRYMIVSELGVRVLEAPEDLIEIDGRERGNLIHDVLERFFAKQCDLPADRRKRPGESWTEQDHAELDEIIDVVFDEFENLGLTGNKAIWTPLAARTRRELHRVLTVDDDYRSRYRATPEAVEFTFGTAPDPEVAVRLGDGRTAHFRGRVDRVDLTSDGSATVFDYKSGDDSAYSALDTDPVKRGQLMQLPLYALAAQSRTGASTSIAGYWFTSQRAKAPQHVVELDEQAKTRFGEVLDALITAIDSGEFPARPIDGGDKDRSMCTYCDVRAACQNGRNGTWKLLKSTPEISPLLSVIDTPWTKGGEA